MVRRVVGLGLVVTSLLVLTGCGGRGEKGVNQDKDRPRTVETKK